MIDRNEKLALEIARNERGDALIDAHREVHALICDNQNDRCAVTAEIAMKVITIMQRFALLKGCGDELRAFSLVEPDTYGSDLVYVMIQTEPDSDGFYECCSASDNIKYVCGPEPQVVEQVEIPSNKSGLSNCGDWCSYVD